MTATDSGTLRHPLGLAGGCLPSSHRSPDSARLDSVAGDSRERRGSMTTTASLPDAVCAPVLTFGVQPDGQYPQVLLDDSCGDMVRAPVGGAPLRVLRDPKAVLACLDLYSRTGPGAASPRIVMAGAHPVTGTLRGCPLTGAEQQSADGGLLNMNPPRLTGYRRQLSGLFSVAAAESTRRSHWADHSPRWATTSNPGTVLATREALLAPGCLTSAIRGIPGRPR